MYGTFLYEKAKVAWNLLRIRTARLFSLQPNEVFPNYGILHIFQMIRSKRRNKNWGSACRESNPDHFSARSQICDSSPRVSEVSRLYDILIFSKNTFCGGNRIRTYSAQKHLIYSQVQLSNSGVHPSILSKPPLP